MNGWTLEYQTVEKPFAKRTILNGAEVLGWGLSQPSMTFINQGTDTCSFEQPGVEFDSPPIFEADEVAIIRYNGVRKFVGRLRAPQRLETSATSGFRWMIEGPWQWLEEIIYRQVWSKFAVIDDEEAALVDDYSGRLFLCQDELGNLITTGAQIVAVVNWAIARGALLALDTSDIPSLNSPVMEVRNAYCSECIIQLLRLAPDAVTWFDYSTEPYPTLKIKRRGSFVDDEYVIGLTPVNITPGDGNLLVSASIVPKDKLKTSGVVIEYEQTSTVNGQPRFYRSFDIWGQAEADFIANGGDINDLPISVEDGGTSGIAPRTLVATINLEGGSTSFAEARIVTEPILSNSTTPATRLTWWQDKRPELARTAYDAANPERTWIRKIVPVVVAGVASEPAREIITAITRDGSLDNELTKGQYAEWMGGEFEDETIEALLSYEVIQMISGVERVVQKFVNEPASVKIKTTSLSSGLFRSSPSGTYAETMPTGMARFLFESTSVLQYDGSLTLEEEEVSGLVHMGNVVNLLGGAEEFETMNALVQQVTWDVERGQTQVQIGFPRIWQAEDLMEMLRGLRYRQRWTTLATRYTGLGGTIGNTTLGKDHAKESNTNGKAARLVLSLYDPSTPNDAMIQLDIGQIKTLMAANTITAAQMGTITGRVVNVSRNNNGTCQDGKMVFICSNFIPT